ncbi:MAG TPA: carbon monoxide dehydrogenase beta subunit family protein [Candidatus Limnocylindrales bacterium]|nr:carbon monoxide dehydrogenase beta subunit family protein [Candidatus Limnocylindrales bacterium]
MMTEITREDYRWMVGPEPISQAAHPEKEMALVEGDMIPLEEALIKIAEKVLGAKKPVMVVPGRIVLWSWEDGAPEKAKVLRELAEAMGAEIRPIFDLRPQYPVARTAVEINPYHGDLVIAHEKYDVAVFYGVECLYADVALKIIDQGTECYTVALCGKIGHVDASITLRDTGMARLKYLTEIIRKVKQEKASGTDAVQ